MNHDVAGSGGIAVQVDGVTKSYGHVEALRGVSMRLHRGEILGLLGDNGAGKSTLLKCITGDIAYDRGRIEIGGEHLRPGAVTASRRLGLEAVYQDLALAADLSIRDNVYLGRELTVRDFRRHFGWLDRKAMQAEADKAISGLGASLPSLTRRVDRLSGGQRQAVAIARARIWAKQVILLDEPTAALGVKQTALVEKMMRAVAASGVAVLLVSHDVPRVLGLAHRVLIMRQGRVVRDDPAAKLNLSQVVETMLGRDDGDNRE